MADFGGQIVQDVKPGIAFRAGPSNDQNADIDTSGLTVLDRHRTEEKEDPR